MSTECCIPKDHINIKYFLEVNMAKGVHTWPYLNMSPWTEEGQQGVQLFKVTPPTSEGWGGSYIRAHFHVFRCGMCRVQVAVGMPRWWRLSTCFRQPTRSLYGKLKYALTGMLVATFSLISIWWKKSAYYDCMMMMVCSPATFCSDLWFKKHINILLLYDDDGGYILQCAAEQVLQERQHVSFNLKTEKGCPGHLHDWTPLFIPGSV